MTFILYPVTPASSGHVLQGCVPSAKQDCRYLSRVWKMSVEASLLVLTFFIDRDDKKRNRVQKIESDRPEKHEIALFRGR